MRDSLLVVVVAVFDVVVVVLLAAEMATMKEAGFCLCLPSCRLKCI